MWLVLKQMLQDFQCMFDHFVDTRHYRWKCYIPFHYRSSHQRCSTKVFYKKGVLENFTKFTEKLLCQSLFFNKVAGLRPATLLKKRLWHRCFGAKFLRVAILENISGRLLLSLLWLFSKYCFYLVNRIIKLNIISAQYILGICAYNIWHISITTD